MLAAHSVYGPDGMLVGVCPTRKLAAKVAHNLTQLGDDVFFIKEALPEEIRDMLAEPAPVSGWKQLYFPVPKGGMAVCKMPNLLGFEVGRAYRFHTQVRAERFPPYDYITVENDDYSDDSHTAWYFVNNHTDAFRKAFEILEPGSKEAHRGSPKVSDLCITPRYEGPWG